MFTIGREREKSHAEERIKKAEDVALIYTVIDAVHDVLDGRVSVDGAIPIFTRAFIDGGSGVWEQTGVWARKLAAEHPAIAAFWAPMAQHDSAKIRFRVAAFLDDMPQPVRAELFPLLLNDSSAKVRAKVAGDRGVTPRAGDLAFLVARRAQETDSTVIASLDYALSAAGNAKVSDSAC